MIKLTRLSGEEFILNADLIRFIESQPDTHIILTTKGGEKIDGTLYGEDADWFRVDTPTGTVSVRKADVSRVETPKK